MPLLIKTPSDFANALLGALGLPDTKNNVDNLIGWARAEGGAGPQFGISANDDNFNPFNTTLALPGSHGTNGPGVQSYTSWIEGLQGTVDTLEGSSSYDPILNALKGNAPWAEFSQAVAVSPWGTHGLASDPQGTGGSAETPFYQSGLDVSPGSISPSITGTPPAKGTSPNAPSGASPNAKGKAASANAQSFKGFAGILQQLNEYYNPKEPGLIAEVESLGATSLENIAVQIFTRAASSFVFLAILGVGVMTLVRGSSGGSAAGGGDVFEFIAGQQKIAERGKDRAERTAEHERVQTRHEQREPRLAESLRVKEEDIGLGHRRVDLGHQNRRERRNARIYNAKQDRERTRRQEAERTYSPPTHYP
jgi:hypothetical protein